eukprot:1058125-Karenia_brevis.AAC.1
MTINSKELKASIETSPQRRALYKSFYKGLDMIRSFKLYHMPGYVTLGEIPKGSSEIVWNASACTEAGLDPDV